MLKFFIFCLILLIAWYFELLLLIITIAVVMMVFGSYDNVKPVGDYERLYKNMPDGWQNIMEMINLGNRSGYTIKENHDSISKFYQTLIIMANRYKLLEVKVNEDMVEAYERKHDIRPALVITNRGPVFIEPKARALFYYTDIINNHPERLDEILETVLVKKMPKGYHRHYGLKKKLLT